MIDLCTLETSVLYGKSRPAVYSCIFEFLVLLRLALCYYQINHVNIPLVIFVRTLLFLDISINELLITLKMNIKHYCTVKYEDTLILFS